MPTTYINPGMVNAADTARVLAFLNGPADAPLLLNALNNLGDTSIDIGIAGRIIAKRTSVGGRFTTLSEFDETPLIGPERFTIIVELILKGKVTPPIPVSSYGEAIARMSGELAALRAVLRGDAVLPQPAISIATVPAAPYLGQPVRVTVRVWDRVSGAPLANRRLTIFPREGLVRSAYPCDGVAQTASEIQSDTNGTASFMLLPHTDEPLFQEHLDALAAFLADLPENAAAPVEILPLLTSLAGAYGKAFNVALSEAIDILFRRYAAGVDAAAFRSGCMELWTCVSLTFAVMLHEEASASSGSIAATSVATLTYKNWLEPWYHLLSKDLVENSSLEGDLAAAVSDAGNDAFMQDAIAGIGRKFARNHFGLINRQAGKKALTASLRSAAESVSATLGSDRGNLLIRTVDTISENFSDGFILRRGALFASRLNSDLLKVDTPILKPVIPPIG